MQAPAMSPSGSSQRAVLESSCGRSCQSSSFTSRGAPPRRCNRRLSSDSAPPARRASAAAWPPRAIRDWSCELVLACVAAGKRGIALRCAQSISFSRVGPSGVSHGSGAGSAGRPPSAPALRPRAACGLAARVGPRASEAALRPSPRRVAPCAAVLRDAAPCCSGRRAERPPCSRPASPRS